MKDIVIGLRVANQFGVLARVSGMFSRRGFNIDTLTVGETETPGISRITISTKCDDSTREQIIKQLGKLHDVREIAVMSPSKSVFRELLLIKIATTSENRQEVMDAVNVFRSKIIDYAADSMCVEITGESQKINAFVDLMKPFGILEMCRTGVVSLNRGRECLKDLSEDD